MIFKRIQLSGRQRKTLNKVFLNASNAILAGWILTRFVEQQRVVRTDLLWGSGLYLLTIFIALWIYR